MSQGTLIGRGEEIAKLEKALGLGRNLLIEGPVGVGKTYLVHQVLKKLGKSVIRVDGDGRYTEQKLTGWFDPPVVLKQGYIEEAFMEGPLLQAMTQGSALFINELNRMPESVQNVLLPAMDEGRLTIPRVGDRLAKPGFLVIATQNPREFTATHALSEALMDRFEMLQLRYQSQSEERQILDPYSAESEIADAALAVVRATRSHRAIKRGASVRAAISVCELANGGLSFVDACLMALPGRIELVSSDHDPEVVIRAMLDEMGYDTGEKKN